MRRLRQWYTGRRSMPRYYIQPGRKMRPSKRTVRFETQPGYHLSATPGKKLIWWLPDNSAPGLTAASLNHAEYQRGKRPDTPGRSVSQCVHRGTGNQKNLKNNTPYYRTRCVLLSSTGQTLLLCNLLLPVLFPSFSVCRTQVRFFYFLHIEINGKLRAEFAGLCRSASLTFFALTSQVMAQSEIYWLQR